ncbi:MAG: thioesterase family protein [Labilithrix sp.]
MVQHAITSVSIPVAWGEMDAYGHVNNAVFLRWLETARIRWFEDVAYPEADGKTGPVLRTALVEYLLPVKYPDTVQVTARPTKLGRSSVTLAYEVTSDAQRVVVAKGESVVVFADFVAGGSVPLPDDARARIEARLA